MQTNDKVLTVKGLWIANGMIIEYSIYNAIV